MRLGVILALALAASLAACAKTDAMRCDDICAKSKECDATVDEVSCRAICKDRLNTEGVACSTSLAKLDDCYASATCTNLYDQCIDEYDAAASDCSW